MRQSRAPRVARGAVAASIATFAALMSHVAAGGDVPGWAGIAVPWVLSVAVCTLLAGRALSAVRLSLAVVASQLLFHTLFVVGSVSPRASGAPAGHAHHASHDLLTASAPATGGGVAVALVADPTMWASHAFAAFVTVLALHRGERAARALLRGARELLSWARRALTRIVVPVLTVPFRAAVVASDAVMPLLVRVQESLPRRGPPSPIVL